MLFLLTLEIAIMCYQAFAMEGHYTTVSWRLFGAGFGLIGLLTLTVIFQASLPAILAETNIRRAIQAVAYGLIICGMDIYRRDRRALRRVKSAGGEMRASGAQPTRYWSERLDAIEEKVDRLSEAVERSRT